MSRVDDLVQNYERFVALKWQENLAPPQRVWMAVYPSVDERRLRLHVPAFKTATEKSECVWGLIDLSTRFEAWMAAHEYRDAYFEDPELLPPALSRFMDDLVEEVRAELESYSAPNVVVGLLGGGSLFGLGDQVKLSLLIERVQDKIAGRMLVFFPGEHEGSSYRLLGARDGWNYLATPITAEKH